MRIETNRDKAPPRRLPGAVTCATAVVVLLSFDILGLPATAVRAQTPGPEAPPPPPSADVPPPPAPVPPPQNAAGMFGNWFQQSGQLMQQSGQLMQQGVANMQQGVTSFGEMVGAISGQANQATKEAVDAARNAATSVSKLPGTGVTAGHERCVIAPNGAPDCRGAAVALCRGKGYANGASVDFVTVENCPPPWRTARGDEIPEGVCTMEHYVTKALCQ